MIISWNITKECNLACKHCYRDAGPGRRERDELSTEEGKRLIEGISKAGFKRLIFSGGEPLVRDDLFELASHAASLGLIPVLGTNGTLINRGISRRLRAAGFKAVGVSLDSLQADYHDSLRQKPGSWEKAVAGIRNCLEEGLKVQVNTTVTRDNFAQVLLITEAVARLGASAHHPFFLVQTGRGRDIEEKALSKEQYRKLIRLIIEKQARIELELKPTCAPQFMVEAEERNVPMRFTRGCIAGISYCCVLPNGDVHICPYLPVKTGNVREEPFEKIWESSEVFNGLRDYSSYKGKCGKCLHNSICGGCRARAYFATGDWLQEDPWCLKGERACLD